MHSRYMTEERIKAVTEAICAKVGVTPEALAGGVEWGEGNSRKLWAAVAEATGFTAGQLRGALMNYRNPSGSCHRPEFEARIRTLAPQWWGDKDSASKKAELKAMALRGEPRPSKNGKNKHPLGHPLCDYTNTSRACYDQVFDQDIRVLAPQWFLDTAALNKAELKAMALRGEPRPNQKKHPRGEALCRYTNPKSNNYDQVFDQEIRALRPDWFVDTAALNKAELKAMALRKESRPNQKKHPLGRALCEYTNPKSDSYDPVFDQEIRALRPDWFTYSDNLRKTRTTKKAKTP